MKFRLLRADEIDCRVSKVVANGIFLLLYKDARCDQNILDETVGSMNWQRHHSRENANCIVSIWDEDKAMWVEKEDTGTESNTEAEKGLASDSFKRACFNWGIGRELYTAPKMMYIPNSMLDKRDGKKVYDRFIVTEIEYIDKKIKSVVVQNTENGKKKTFTHDVVAAPVIDEAKFRAGVLKELNNHSETYISQVCDHYGVESPNRMTTEQMQDYFKKLEGKK